MKSIFFLSVLALGGSLYGRAQQPADSVAVACDSLAAVAPLCDTATVSHADTVATPATDSLMTALSGQLVSFAPGELSRRPPVWRPLAEVFAVNVGVWAFDRFVLDSDFSQISPKTMWHNIRHGFVWDNDKFSTNLFAHPYHGSLYFNTARSQGYGFWESVPFAAAGSLMWEFLGENEPASINDWIATTIGGSALGEITHRISSLCLDDRTTGWQRVGREALAFAVSPMRGLNRLLNGQAWRVTGATPRHDFTALPVHLSIGLGTRYLADHNSLFRGEHAPFTHLRLVYGSPFAPQRAPYDYFDVSVTANFTSNQPLLSEVNLLAQLFVRDFRLNPSMQVRAGLYQHFNYFDSEPVIDGSDEIPFKISEAAAFGPGFIFRVAAPDGESLITQQLFGTFIALGGSLTDHYRVGDRNYNLGSGFSLQSNTLMRVGKHLNFALRTKNYLLFTWKGYRPESVQTIESIYLNAQGDKGRARLSVINFELSFPIAQALRIGWDNYYYHRSTHYAEFPTVKSDTFETRLASIGNSDAFVPHHRPVLRFSRSDRAFLWDICAESPLLSHKIALVCGISSPFSPSVWGACSAGHVFSPRPSPKFGKKRNPRTRNRSSTTENGRKNASRVKNTQKNLVVREITRIFAV